MFRCPNPKCGQAVTLPFGEFMVYNSRDMKNPIISVPLQGNDLIATLAKSEKLFSDESMDKLNPDLKEKYRNTFYSIWNSDESIECPRCNRSATFTQWKRCYEDPHFYGFETPDLCFCGEEMMLDRTPLGQFALYCDECEEFKPNSRAFSGTSDTTVI